MRPRTASVLVLSLVVLAPPSCRGGRDAPNAGAGPSSVRLVGPEEPGRPLVITGRVFAADGTTPLEGARLDLYHTDAGGYYTRPVSVAREARIRGSVWTDEDGRYEFRTIVPGKYPSGGQPAHVHAHLAAPGVPDHWIPSYLFAGDPDLEAEELEAAAERASFSNVLTLEEDEDGVLRGARDVRLDPERARANRLVDGWYAGE